MYSQEVVSRDCQQAVMIGGQESRSVVSRLVCCSRHHVCQGGKTSHMNGTLHLGTARAGQRLYSHNRTMTLV
jgi:hypothetical protein